MRNFKLFITVFVMGFSIASVNAQGLSVKTDEELESMKKEAIASENFELAKKIKEEQSNRKALDDKLKEKHEELNTALANEDFGKAELLKTEIAQLEKDIAKLKELEEDRKIAIFQEKYDEVIAIEAQMEAIRTGATQQSIQPQVEPTPAPMVETTPTTNNNAALLTALGNNNTVTKTRLKKVGLDEVEYKDKVISQFGFGKRTYTYEWSYEEYDWNTGGYNTVYNSYDESVFSLTFNVSRWWANKYLVGGYFYDFSPSEYGGVSMGAQMTGLADFDAIILPYGSFGMGPGFNAWDEEFYFPMIIRAGTYLFFNQKRSVGAFAELNIHLNNEYMPKYRVGIAWSYVKRRARK